MFTIQGKSIANFEGYRTVSDHNRDGKGTIQIHFKDYTETWEYETVEEKDIALFKLNEELQAFNVYQPRERV